MKEVAGWNCGEGMGSVPGASRRGTNRGLAAIISEPPIMRAILLCWLLLVFARQAAAGSVLRFHPRTHFKKPFCGPPKPLPDCRPPQPGKQRRCSAAPAQILSLKRVPHRNALACCSDPTGVPLVCLPGYGYFPSVQLNATTRPQPLCVPCASGYFSRGGGSAQQPASCLSCGPGDGFITPQGAASAADCACAAGFGGSGCRKCRPGEYRCARQAGAVDIE